MLAIYCDSKNQPKAKMDEILMLWAKEQLDEAKEDNCLVFVACHYPLLLDTIGNNKDFSDNNAEFTLK